MPIGKSTTVCMVSDIHIPHHMRKEWHAFRLWHADARPSKTIIAGDFLDLEQLSSYDKNPASSVRVIPEIQAFVREANALAAECGELVIIEGNHEGRWAKAMKELATRLYGAIGLTLREQCISQGLNPSIKWEVEDQHWRGVEVAQMTVRHGHIDAGRFGAGKHIAASLLDKTLGRSITVGHHHTVQLFCRRNDRGELCIASCNGTFEQPAGFAPGNPWVYGFTVYEICNPTWCTPHPIIIEKGVFAYGGKVYDGTHYELEAPEPDTKSDVPLPSHPPYPVYFERVEKNIDDFEAASKAILAQHDEVVPPPPIMPREVRPTAGVRAHMVRHPDGRIKPLIDWARELNMSRNTLTYRLERVKRESGYTMEMALTPKVPE